MANALAAPLEDAGITRGDDNDARALCGHLQGMGGAVQLHPVVAFVFREAGAVGHAANIGDVADNIGGLAKGCLHLGCHQVIVPGAEPCNRHPPGHGLRQGLGHLGRDKRVVTGAEARDMKDAAHVSASGLRPWPWTKTIAK